MSIKICKYENVKESGEIVCLIDQFNNCVGSENCECFVDQTNTEQKVNGNE